MVDQEDGAFNLKYTHLFTKSEFILEANVGYSFSNLNRYDPLLKENPLS